MQPSQFNVQVPLPDRNEVFLMNTFSDAQLLVSPDVAGLLERVARGDEGASVHRLLPANARGVWAPAAPLPRVPRARCSRVPRYR